MEHHIPVLIEQDEDNVFIVSAPTLRGCHSYGNTMEEAMQNITEAVMLCLQDEPHGGISGILGHFGDTLLN